MHRILFPENALVGKNVPKNKIYQHASAGTRVKRLFIEQVEKIIWAYKLAPETVNLPATKRVQEVQVFRLTLKCGEISNSTLEAIDKSIPSPLVFEVEYKNRICYKAAFKRPSEADKNKWVVAEYFSTEWVKPGSAQNELPVALDMGQLYQELLKLIIPVEVRKNETIDDLVLRAEKLESKKREAEKIKSRITREKQFNRKVEINKTLKVLQKEIERLEL
jgi:hypothetical protein